MSDQNNQWKQYEEIGSAYISAIVSYVELLKPFITEIGWNALDIDVGNGRVLIEFNKPDDSSE